MFVYSFFDWFICIILTNTNDIDRYSVASLKALKFQSSSQAELDFGVCLTVLDLFFPSEFNALEVKQKTKRKILSRPGILRVEENV